MNKDLKEIIKLYTTKSHKELVGNLLDKSKDNIIAILIDLITIYINDKNSSTLREIITVLLSGYKHLERKIGFNGFRQTSMGETLFCEAKPKNFDTEEYEKFLEKKRKNPPAKLNGYGNFSDYTHKRMERDKKENLSMLISGFVDGKLIYILEFPFKTNSFTTKLEEQLNKMFPNGDESGKFLRSANFSYKDYINSKECKINFILEKNELEKLEKYINREFFKYLIEKSK